MSERFFAGLMALYGACQGIVVSEYDKGRWQESGFPHSSCLVCLVGEEEGSEPVMY